MISKFIGWCLDNRFLVLTLTTIQLTVVPGVAEVATVGGAVRQYQVTLDPRRLLLY